VTDWAIGCQFSNERPQPLDLGVAFPQSACKPLAFFVGHRSGI
jgi:hypothetical protein